MPRIARIVVPGCAHHVTQRGNNKQDVFFVDEDRRAYLGFLKRAAAQHGLAIHGYCLMTNHVHLVATPKEENSLAKALGRTHVAYAQYVNQLHGRSGHLWQSRFFSCALDEDHYWAALRYVEQNPVRARLCRMPWRYPWSSAAAHLGEGDASGLLDLRAFSRKMDAVNWQAALVERLDPGMLHDLRLRTRTGRPLAGDTFLSRLETQLGRRLRALPPGRPKGWRKRTKTGKNATK
jgi:putative transposase